MIIKNVIFFLIKAHHFETGKSFESFAFPQAINIHSTKAQMLPAINKIAANIDKTDKLANPAAERLP